MLTNATAKCTWHTLVYCTCFGHTSSAPIESSDAVLSAAARGVEGRTKSGRDRGHMMRPLPHTPGTSDVVQRDEVQIMARGGGGQVLARRSGRARKVMRRVRFPSSLQLAYARV
jgi:hypothetical protein